MKNKIIWIVIAVVVIGGIVWMNKSKKPAMTGEVVKIGAALGLTGDAASWGEEERNGINLALKNINENGGIDGKTLEVIFEDTKNSSQGSVSAVQKLVNFDGLSFIVGPTWLDSYPGAQGVVKGKGAVMISPSASITAVQQGETINNVFSTWYRVDSITDGLAKAVKAKGDTKIALVFQNDAYYTEFIDFFKAAAKNEGIEVISENLLNPGQSDLKTTFSKIKASGADGIVFGMYDEKMVAGFLKDHSQVIPDISLYSNEVIRQYIESENDYKQYLEGAVFVENAQLTKEFVDKYRTAYSKEPAFSASTAYDATNIIAEVLRNNTSDPAEYLHSHSFKTVSFGDITFDEIGGVVTKNKQYQVREVLNGEIK